MSDVDTYTRRALDALQRASTRIVTAQHTHTHTHSVAAHEAQSMTRVAHAMAHVHAATMRGTVEQPQHGTGSVATATARVVSEAASLAARIASIRADRRVHRHAGFSRKAFPGRIARLLGATGRSRPVAGSAFRTQLHNPNMYSPTHVGGFVAGPKLQVREHDMATWTWLTIGDWINDAAGSTNRFRTASRGSTASVSQLITVLTTRFCAVLSTVSEYGTSSSCLCGSVAPQLRSLKQEKDPTMSAEDTARLRVLQRHQPPKGTAPQRTHVCRSATCSSRTHSAPFAIDHDALGARNIEQCVIDAWTGGVRSPSLCPTRRA